MDFLLVNVNPKNRKTGDCSIRAICQATNLPYDEIAKMLFDEWMENGYAIGCKECEEVILKKLGFEKHKKPFQPNGKTYTAGELECLLPKDSIAVVTVANHLTCIKGGEKLIDLWDCSGKSVYGYWLKEHCSEDELRVYGGEIKKRVPCRGRRVRLY